MAENSQNSLNLLLDYSSSDSESDSDSPNHKTLKSQSVHPDKSKPAKPKLPLPTDLFDKFQVQNPVDNPEQHGGRIRSFPHERNSWATLVYIPLKNNLTLFHARLKHELIALGIDVEVISEPHLSLSKTLVLPHHWIEPLVETLGKSLSHLNRLTIKFSSVEIFCNEEKTRTFIALGANSCKSLLVHFVQAVDSAAAEFKLPKYYEEPHFHASIAWCLHDKTSDLQPLRIKLNALLNQFKVDSGDDCCVTVSHIHMKSGNKLFSFPLA